MSTIATLLEEARRALARAPFAPPVREANLLMARCLGLTEAQVLARAREPAPAEAAREFRRLLGRRLRGEPVAYLFGEKEFYGRSFAVDSRVLIPRPETEHLVEAALARTLPRSARILEVGTGSGCIAVTLALELADARIVATDLSLGALQVAAENSARHGVASRVRLVRCDLLQALRQDVFDLVVCNPPYVNPEDTQRLSPEVRDFEPHVALFAADGGLDALRRLMAAAQHPAAGGLIVEIGLGQLDEVRRLARETSLSVVEVVPDLAGIPRTVVLLGK